MSGKVKTIKSSRMPVECMVCGKIFPRGEKDLLRHKTAPTLLHVFEPSRTAECTHGCSICNIHFTNSTHLARHEEETSCGKRRLRELRGETEEEAEDKTTQNSADIGSMVDDDSAATDAKSDKAAVKKVKILRPNDRKAFYAVCSLFIDNDKALETKPNEENVYDLIRPEYRDLVERYAAMLQHDC